MEKGYAGTSVHETVPFTGKNSRTALHVTIIPVYHCRVEDRIRLFLLDGCMIPIFHDTVLVSFRDDFLTPPKKWLLRFERQFQVRFWLEMGVTAGIFVRHIRGRVLEFVLSDRNLEKRKEEAVL